MLETLCHVVLHQDDPYIPFVTIAGNPGITITDRSIEMLVDSIGDRLEELGVGDFLVHTEARIQIGEATARIRFANDDHLVERIRLAEFIIWALGDTEGWANHLGPDKFGEYLIVACLRSDRIGDLRDSLADEEAPVLAVVSNRGTLLTRQLFSQDSLEAAGYETMDADDFDDLTLGEFVDASPTLDMDGQIIEMPANTLLFERTQARRDRILKSAGRETGLLCI